MMFKENTTVFYHKNCTDGFTSAYLLYRAYKALNITDTVFYAINYYEEIPEVKSKTLIIIDFSFSKDIIDKFIEKEIDVHLYDHHETAALQYGGYGRYRCKGFNCCIEKEKSGTGLAFDLIQATNAIDEKELGILKYIAERIQDRDLWKFKYSDTKAVYELLNSVEYNFQKWDELIFSSTLFMERLADMKIRVEFRDQLAEEYANKARMIQIQGYTVPCVNVPSNFASYVGDILNKNYPFSLMYVVGEIVYVSLRSDADKGIDTSVISKHFGGGGHKNASGFKLNLIQLFDLLSDKL